MLLLAAGLCQAQIVPGGSREREDKDRPVRLPDGTLQSEAILKKEHEQTLKDAAELRKLIQEVVEALEKSDRNLVSLPVVRKLDEIEKRARQIRRRLAP